MIYCSWFGLVCFSAALSVTYNFCFARSYPASHFQLLKTGCHAICPYVLSLLIIRHPLNALGNTCCRLDHYLEIQRQILFSLSISVSLVVTGEYKSKTWTCKLHVNRFVHTRYPLWHNIYQRLQVLVAWKVRLITHKKKKIFNWGVCSNIISVHFTSSTTCRVAVVSVLIAGSSSPDSSTGHGHCVMFLGKTLYSHSATFHPGVINGYLRI